MYSQVGTSSSKEHRWLCSLGCWHTLLGTGKNLSIVWSLPAPTSPVCLYMQKRVKQTQISDLPSIPLTPFLSANRFLLVVLMFCFGYLLIDLLIYIFLFDVCLRPLRLGQQGMARRKNSEQTWNSCKFWDLLGHIACIVLQMGF